MGTKVDHFPINITPETGPRRFEPDRASKTLETDILDIAMRPV